MIDSLSRYVSSPPGEPSPSSSSSSDGETRPSHIPGLDIRSSFNEASLREFVQENKLSDIRYFIPTPYFQVSDPPIGGTGFYAHVLEDGIGLPIHPFFYEVLSSYGIAPGQLTPHMVP